VKGRTENTLLDKVFLSTFLEVTFSTATGVFTSLRRLFAKIWVNGRFADVS
jgi:hypothetical protein